VIVALGVPLAAGAYIPPVDGWATLVFMRRREYI
jgi:hypothetical protein